MMDTVQHLARWSLAVAVLLASCQPAPTARPIATDAGVTPVGPRRVVLYATAREGAVRADVWRLGPTPAASLSLNFSVDVGVPGGVDASDTGCSLSANGLWLAYMAHGQLHARSIVGGRDVRLPATAGGPVAMRPVAWSPDSGRLLLWREADTAPAGDGATVMSGGAFVATLPTLVPVRVPDVAMAEGWSPDGSAVFYPRSLPPEGTLPARTELMQAPVAGGDPWVVLETHGVHGFAQMAVQGASLAWVSTTVESVTADTRYRTWIARAELDGAQPAAITEVYNGNGNEALAAPRFSPDGSRLVWVRQDRPVHPHGTAVFRNPVGHGEPYELYRCAADCRAQWESADSVLVLDGRTLVRVPLRGGAVPIATGVTALIVAGT